MAKKEFGDRLIFSITQKEIEDYRLKVFKNFSAVSANRRLYVIQRVFRKAVVDGAAREDTSKGIKPLSEKKHERKSYILVEDVAKLLDAAQKTLAKHYLPAAILLSIEHGAALQEILDLKWGDINFKHDTIRFFRTKNGAERTMRLMEYSKAELLHWKSHLERSREKRAIEVVEDKYVFCHLNGSRLKSFRTAYKKAIRLAGLNDYTFHDNRHTYASVIILNGGTLKDVMEMIGHKDMRSANRYAHLDVLRKTSMNDRMAEYYGMLGAKR